MMVSNVALYDTAMTQQLKAVRHGIRRLCMIFMQTSKNLSQAMNAESTN